MAATLSWPKMLDGIEAIVEQCGALSCSNGNKQAIISILQRYQPDEREYKQYVHFDTSGYTKNLVREINRGQCNVILMCWSGGQSSAFHGHEGSRCFVKVLAGELREQQVSYPPLAGELEIVRTYDKILRPNDVSYIDDFIGCHRISNVSPDKPALTLHIYMPAYKRCRIFDTKDNKLRISTSESIDVTFNTVEGMVVTQ